ncbi:ScyD/ScyE family protein [Nocardioides sp. HB32]
MSYISKRVMLSLAAAVPLLLASAPAAVLAAPATAASVSSTSGAAAPTRQASGTSSCSHDRLRAAGSAPRLLASGLEGALGSTIGPDGALYAVEGIAGEVARIDRCSGAVSTWASGLPTRVLEGPGGAMDIAFVRGVAYVLVSLVGSDVGGDSVVGIYRVDGPTTVTPVADIGSWAIANPPAPAFFVPSGVQFALLPWRGDLLVTDGHHNRVLRVDLDGAEGANVSEVIAFDDIVPTGLERRGHTVLMAEAGPVPHLPENGKVVAFRPGGTTVREVAAGARLAVDVESGARGLYVLSQGEFTPGNPEGSPADPDTGALMRVRRDGTLTSVASGLDRPTSMEIVGRRAYVVDLDGDIWSICLRSDRHQG